MHRLTVSLLFGLSCVPAWSQQPAANLQSVAFLSGHWTSQADGEVDEEYWSPVISNNVVGTFRVIKNGAAIFYEFWAVELDGGTPVFKMKHFHANLLGWEEKADSVQLPVVEASPNVVLFSRPDGSLSLRYERKGDTLISTLHQVRAGKPHDEVFTLHRAD